MNDTLSLDSESFDSLLSALDEDRDQAGIKYETARKRLTLYFGAFGLDDAEGLADETLNRVTTKIGDFHNHGDFSAFMSFSRAIARYVRLEQMRVSRRFVDESFFPELPAIEIGEEEESNPAMGCLEECLSQLNEEERTLVIRFYKCEGSEKNRDRKKIAETLNLTTSALYTRISRLRKKLSKCLIGCLEEKTL